MNNLNAQQKQYLVFGIIGIVLLAFAVIIISTLDVGQTESADVTYENIGYSRSDDGRPVLGNPNAPITIVEFADFLCSHCQDYKSTVNQVIEELVATGQAKFEFRLFPVINQDSYYLGNLLQCTDTLGGDNAYWQAHDLLYSYVTSGNSSSVAGRNLATELGLDYADLLECTDNADWIEGNRALGESAGVTGTPSVRMRVGDGGLQFIGGSQASIVSFDQIKAVVDAANG